MADLRSLIRGTSDGSAIPLLFAMEILTSWWRNRALLEISPGKFVFTWEYSGTTSWKSLSDKEKSLLEALMARRRSESMALWERAGRKILAAITGDVDMRACAEDLGAVPPCVPLVLGELGIPGLRVLRWHRSWDRPGSPYVPFNEYPEESVACTSVHDSTNLRQWWSQEAERDILWAMASEALGMAPTAAPAELDPDSALFFIKAFASVQSRLLVFPLQDLLATSQAHREEKAVDERINVPGTSDGSNWLYRVKPDLDTLLADASLRARLSSLHR
jgi:4-alpha-glucanotransferase